MANSSVTSEESLPGARHSVALMGCVFDKKSATEWRAPSEDS